MRQHLYASAYLIPKHWGVRQEGKLLSDFELGVVTVSWLRLDRSITGLARVFTLRSTQSSFRFHALWQHHTLLSIYDGCRVQHRHVLGEMVQERQNTTHKASMSTLWVFEWRRERKLPVNLHTELWLTLGHIMVWRRAGAVHRARQYGPWVKLTGDDESSVQFGPNRQRKIRGLPHSSSVSLSFGGTPTQESMVQSGVGDTIFYKLGVGLFLEVTHPSASPHHLPSPLPLSKIPPQAVIEWIGYFCSSHPPFRSTLYLNDKKKSHPPRPLHTALCNTVYIFEVDRWPHYCPVQFNGYKLRRMELAHFVPQRPLQLMRPSCHHNEASTSSCACRKVTPTFLDEVTNRGWTGFIAIELKWTADIWCSTSGYGVGVPHKHLPQLPFLQFHSIHKKASAEQKELES